MILKRTAWLAARAFRKAAQALDRAADAQTLAIQRGMSAEDMESDPDEQYYAQQYWKWLEPELARIAPHRDARTLDIGCGHGRFSLPLARRFDRGRVTGVDLTPAAIEAARVKAASLGLPNLDLHAGDALSFVSALPAGSFDIALMIEVSFFMRHVTEVVAAAYRALRPGGVFFASFRSQHYNLLHSVRDRDWVSAALARDAREGEWRGTSTWYTWQTPADVQQILTEAGFTLAAPLRGIGVCSGIAGDPLAAIAQPSAMTAPDRHHLMNIETSLAEDYAACGRYILAIASKP